ncbi:MAG: glycosyltransferase family A protein [Chloroflexota bacterium]
MANQQPLVSIGLPLYNGEAYLAETLTSLILQSYPNFEIIIVDNGSTDSSIDICQTFSLRDKRIRIHRNRKNLRAAHNYNLSATLASGKYFTWISQDGLLEPTALECCVEVLESYPDIVMSYPRTILIEGTGNVVGYNKEKLYLDSAKPHIRLRSSLRSSSSSQPFFSLIRHKKLIRTGLMGDYLSSSSVLLSELAMLGRCVEVPEYLAYRRLHSHNSYRFRQSDEEIAEWLEPNNRQSIMGMGLRRLVELNRAIRRTNLKRGEAIRCHLELVHFCLNFGQIHVEFQDLVRVAKRTRQLASSWFAS